MAQIINPTIPYKGPIFEGLHEGKQIIITGCVPVGANKFTINLMNGLDTDRDDRPLHISVRFKGNAVVRNTYHHKSWGKEERSGCFPFTIGRNFNMVILVETSAYQIFVNGQQCWSFTHRLPFALAHSILIDGHVSVERIEFINKVMPQVVYPPLVPHDFNASSSGYNPQVVYPPLAPHDFNASSSGYNPQGIYPPIAPLDFKSSSSGCDVSKCIFPIPGGIRPGMSIYIAGRSTNYPNRFSINIQNGASRIPPPDIALHFDVRFYDNSVVRNSRINGAWCSEETIIPRFPFYPDCNFEVVIKVHSDMYQIRVNGEDFVAFRHRLTAFPYFNILSFENDVIVTSVNFV